MAMVFEAPYRNILVELHKILKNTKKNHSNIMYGYNGRTNINTTCTQTYTYIVLQIQINS